MVEPLLAAILTIARRNPDASEDAIELAAGMPWTRVGCLCVCGEPGWYLVGFGGESSAAGVSQNQMDDNLVAIFNSGGLDVVDLSSTIDDSDTGFGLAGGYQLNDHFAMEFAYVDLGSVHYQAAATVSDGVDEADAEVGLENSAHGPVISAIGILPIGERFSVFGRVGLSLLNAEGKARITLGGSTQQVGQSSQKTDPMFGLGAEFSVSKNFAVRRDLDRLPRLRNEGHRGRRETPISSLLAYRMGSPFRLACMHRNHNALGSIGWPSPCPAENTNTPLARILHRGLIPHTQAPLNSC
jgi:OOP family OmpA-OmpF porin